MSSRSHRTLATSHHHQQMLTQKILEQCSLRDEVRQLWFPQSDTTISDPERTTLYWYHRLQCAPLKTLRRLAQRGTLPRNILKVLKMPLCASCAFAAAHRRACRHKGKTTSSIRRKDHIVLGAGTSCDHMISHQGRLMPQSPVASLTTDFGVASFTTITIPTFCSAS